MKSAPPAAPATTAELLEKYLAHIKRKAKDVAVLAALNRRAGETGEDARGESLEGWLLAEMALMARRTMLTDAGVEYAGAVKNFRSVSGSNGPPTGRMHGWVNLPSREGPRARPESRNVVYVQVSVAFNNASRDAQLARWVRNTDAVTTFAAEQRGGGAVSVLLGVGFSDEPIHAALHETSWAVESGVPICTATGARVRLWALTTEFTARGGARPR
jgi:hypothetical protein